MNRLITQPVTNSAVNNPMKAHFNCVAISTTGLPRESGVLDTAKIIGVSINTKFENARQKSARSTLSHSSVRIFA